MSMPNEGNKDEADGFIRNEMDYMTTDGSSEEENMIDKDWKNKRIFNDMKKLVIQMTGKNESILCFNDNDDTTTTTKRFICGRKKRHHFHQRL